MELSTPPTGGISFCLDCQARGVMSPLRARWVSGKLETSCQACGQVWLGAAYAAVIAAHRQKGK